MPEIKSVYLYNNAYENLTYVSEIIYVAEASSFSFSVFCSVDCVMSIRHMMDIEHSDIILTQSQNITGGQCLQLVSPVKSRYVQFAVTSIASTPCELQCQGFYFF
jgi:hypothetical protein